MRVRQHVEDEQMFLANYADTLTDAPLRRMIDRFRRPAAWPACSPCRQSTHHVIDIGDERSGHRVRPMRELMQWENGGYFILRPGIFAVLRRGRGPGAARVRPADRLQRA